MSKLSPLKASNKAGQAGRKIFTRTKANALALANKYIGWLLPYNKSHGLPLLAVIYVRVSTYTQEYNKNLDMHEQVLRQQLKKRGMIVVACFREVSSGWAKLNHRKKLIQAVKAAKKLGALLVSASTDRFLRNNKYHSIYNFFAAPSKAEFERFKKFIGDVPLFTLLPPDMKPQKIKGFYVKWGQRAKGNKGGRPPKHEPGFYKQRREDKIGHAKHLKQQGMSVRQIAELLEVPRSTVFD